MDYKETLNLPRTAFAMKADLVLREPERLRHWESTRLYERILERRAGGPRFLLHDGPPFANGDVHVGTALNKILKDLVIRSRSLAGAYAPYVPGWDCHGLPIEFKVTQELRQRGETQSGPAAIRRACEAYARHYIDVQRAQFRRLGILGDWDRPYLTLDKAYEAAELRLFADLVERGFVYRGKKPVYWSIPCRTALAEAEVEYQDHVSPSVYVKFPVADHPGTFILIWTTTPWTLPANLAVAYNSTFSYSAVRVGGELYILSTLLLPTVAQKCGWGDYEIVRSLSGEDLARFEYDHPFIARRSRLYAGNSFVENTTGTGFVHCAPGHGMEDYALGLAQGLPIYSPVDDDGRLAHTADLPVEQQMPAVLVGKAILAQRGRSEANEAVVDLLVERGALLAREDYVHSYPHCWRSKTPVIFRAMDQWFIRIDHTPVGADRSFRRLVLDEIDRVEWVPAWGVNRIKGAVESRPDWCISRQRSWGVPIPAFYDASGRPILDAQLIRRTADLVEAEGSNVWFEKSMVELWERVCPPGWEGPQPVAKSADTLDVWIDSGSSSRAVTMCHPVLRRGGEAGGEAWRADMYLEGSDQHRGWFQSSLLLSMAGNGTAPYRTVLTHGFIVDADREKISKSKQGQGGYEKPQTAEAYVKKYGADILRLWFASQDYRNDVIASDERIAKVGESYRLIRNTLRYQLSNLWDFDPAQHVVAAEAMTGLDRWVLGRLAGLEVEVGQAYERYEFHLVYQKLTQFAAVELSATYHDLVKDRLYTDPAAALRRRSTQTALWRLAKALCQMLSPVLAFTADEAWEFLPGTGGVDSVHLTEWKPQPFPLPEAEVARWRQLFELREKCLPELEKARQAGMIGKALEARVTLTASAEGLPGSAEERESLRELLNVSQLDLVVGTGAGLGIEVARAAGTKCERCWHWETNVGEAAAHPTLCARCVGAVGG